MCVCVCVITLRHQHRCINLQEAGIFDRERLWGKIPDGGVDILLTHTPPQGVLSDSVNGCEVTPTRP